MANTSTLTAKERKTINDAVAIILAHTPKGASWSLSPQNYHGTPDFGSTTYFTVGGEQCGSYMGKLPGETLADKIESGIAIQAAEDADQESAKARRIASLRDQLSALEGEAA